MSEQEEAVKKMVHRIEPKKQRIVLSKNREELSDLPESLNAPHFKERASSEEVVEAEWGLEISESRGGRRKLLAGIIVAAVFFLGCVIWAIVLINGAENTVEDEVFQVYEGLSFDEKSELRSAAVIGYLSAETLPDKALYVRDPERVLPLMNAHYKKSPLKPEALNGSMFESPVVGKKGVLWRVKVREKNSKGSEYLLVETQDDGTSLVDWETDVVYQPSDWNAFKTEKSTEAHQFRAYVQIAQLDGFHGFEFSDYNKFRCFKVTVPHSDDYLWAYTEVGSAEDRKMVNLITAGGRKSIQTKRPFPVMLELQYPENGKSARCVHLNRLIQTGWLH